MNDLSTVSAEAPEQPRGELLLCSHVNLAKSLKCLDCVTGMLQDGQLASPVLFVQEPPLNNRRVPHNISGYFAVYRKKKATRRVRSCLYIRNDLKPYTVKRGSLSNEDRAIVGLYVQPGTLTADTVADVQQTSTSTTTVDSVVNTHDSDLPATSDHSDNSDSESTSKEENSDSSVGNDGDPDNAPHTDAFVDDIVQDDLREEERLEYEKLADDVKATVKGLEPLLLCSAYLPRVNNSGDDVLPSVQLRAILDSGLHNQQLLLAGDINAHSPLWGGRPGCTDTRGLDFEDFLIDTQLELPYGVSAPHPPTYASFKHAPLRDLQPESLIGCSWIDILAHSPGLADRVRNWRVREDLFTASDCRLCTFELLVAVPCDHGPRSTSMRKFNIDNFTSLLQADRDSWPDLPDVLQDTDVIDSWILRITNSLRSHHMATVKTPAASSRVKPSPAPWWNESLDKLKSAINTMAKKVGIEWTIRRKAALRDFRKAVRKARSSYYRQFSSAASSPWTVINRLRKKPDPAVSMMEGCHTAEESAKKIFTTLFPQSVPDNQGTRAIRRRLSKQMQKYRRRMSASGCTFVPWTEKEISDCILSTGAFKAPGPDGIPGAILHASLPILLPYWKVIFNSCCRLGYYTRAWKVDKTIPIPKPDKDTYVQPKSYRPIALLSQVGKILERLIVSRLNAMPNGGVTVHDT